MVKIGSLLMTGVFALISGFSTVDTAATQESHLFPVRWHIRGEIVAIEAETISVEGDQGVLRLKHDEETRVHIIGEDSADLGDLEAGDSVLVRSQRQGDDLPLARLIVRLPEGELVAGRVTNLGENSFQLASRDREVMVNVGASSVIALGGYEMLWSGEPAGRDALQVGMRLAAFGTLDEAAAQMTAHTVVARPPRPRWSLGIITSIEGDEIALQRLTGRSVSLAVGENTHYRVGSDAEAALDDFNVGDRVAVFGRRIPGSEVIVALRLAKRV